MPTYAIGFDVYGTLVDPLAVNPALAAALGDRAAAFTQLWRSKQLEYSFRRALMRDYADFDVCTRDALRFTAQTFEVSLGAAAEAAVMAGYQALPAFEDVLPGLSALQGAGHRLVAFSNGVAASLRALLAYARILPALDDIVSVDEIRSFKPDPAVYRHLVTRTSSIPESTWLVSGNAWDVIGARAAGLHAAWLRRNPQQLYEPWGSQPDMIVASLDEFAERLAAL